MRKGDFLVSLATTVMRNRDVPEKAAKGRQRRPEGPKHGLERTENVVCGVRTEKVFTPEFW
jgi:hypothetical protein